MKTTKYEEVKASLVWMRLRAALLCLASFLVTFINHTILAAVFSLVLLVIVLNMVEHERMLIDYIKYNRGRILHDTK